MIGMLIIVVGAILVVAGGLWFLVVTFQESVGWGLGCLIVPFVSLVFLVMHWDKGGRPFLTQLAGVLVVFLGMAMGGNLNL